MPYLNNDVLSIISIYSDIPIYYHKKRLIINTDRKCESCSKRMRLTKNSIVESYSFPKLWEIDKDFFNEETKYIKPQNTFIKFDKKMYTYYEAQNLNIISYIPKYSHLGGYSNNKDQIYGKNINTHDNIIQIFVKKSPSLYIMYKNLKEVLGLTHNKEAFKNKMKEYEKYGFDDKVISLVIKKINILDKPKRIAIRLCSKCRKRMKDGYIFT